MTFVGGPGERIVFIGQKVVVSAAAVVARTDLFKELVPAAVAAAPVATVAGWAWGVVVQNSKSVAAGTVGGAVVAGTALWRYFRQSPDLGVEIKRAEGLQKEIRKIPPQLEAYLLEYVAMLDQREPAADEVAVALEGMTVEDLTPEQVESALDALLNKVRTIIQEQGRNATDYFQILKELKKARADLADAEQKLATAKDALQRTQERVKKTNDTGTATETK